jgi:hypothetical protein
MTRHVRRPHTVQMTVLNQMLSRTFRLSSLTRARTLYTSAPTYNSKHTADSYFKDVDSSPPHDSTIHTVDNATVQRPHDAPASEWSHAGTRTKDYESVNKAEVPYGLNGDKNEKHALRYGGKEKYTTEKDGETSHLGEGPEAKAAGGRKPEGKT